MLIRSKSHQTINCLKTQMVILRISGDLICISASVRNSSVPQSQGTPKLTWVLPLGIPPGFHKDEPREIFLWFWKREGKNSNFEIDKRLLSDKALLFKGKALQELYFSFVREKFLNPSYFWTCCLTQEGEESLELLKKSEPRDV